MSFDEGIRRACLPSRLRSEASAFRTHAARGIMSFMRSSWPLLLVFRLLIWMSVVNVGAKCARRVCGQPLAATNASKTKQTLFSKVSVSLLALDLSSALLMLIAHSIVSLVSVSYSMLSSEEGAARFMGRRGNIETQTCCQLCESVRSGKFETRCYCPGERPRSSVRSLGVAEGIRCYSAC